MRANDDTLNPGMCKPPIPAFDAIGHVLLYAGIGALLGTLVWVVLALRYRLRLSTAVATCFAVAGVGLLVLAFLLLGPSRC